MKFEGVTIDVHNYLVLSIFSQMARRLDIRYSDKYYVLEIKNGVPNRKMTALAVNYGTTIPTKIRA